MVQRIQAIYENGVLRPLEPLNLPDRQEVSLTVQTGENADWLDDDALRFAEIEGDCEIDIEDVRRRLASISGLLSDSVTSERGAY
jgi:predicted DNA-binding antitoxin AbrB/MazE fold protein